MDYQMLVNKKNRLDKNYVPGNLIEIDEITGDKIDDNYINKLEKKAYYYYKKMQRDALNNGYNLFVESSYRSYEYQQKLYDFFIKTRGIFYAKKYCALPGTSEHQTALALDITYIKDNKLVNIIDDKDNEIIWLMNNSYKYGYILRFPRGKKNITGYNYEPWHFRYVEPQISEYIYNNNLTLEEYHTLRRIK